jgi:hypothetical protein
MEFDSTIITWMVNTPIDICIKYLEKTYINWSNSNIGYIQNPTIKMVPIAIDNGCKVWEYSGPFVKINNPIDKDWELCPRYICSKQWSTEIE